MRTVKASVVVIGGGTGTFTILRAIKDYISDISAIINMADDGGSTGLLRDEMGVLPPGDVRQALVALSRSSDVMRELFNYRFGGGSLEGHAFGNLFLSSLEKITGSFPEAVKTAGEVLNIKGRVIPVTTENIHLCLKSEPEDIVGQYHLATMQLPKQPQLYLKPQPKISPEAREAILHADMVIIAPGNLYCSLAPSLLVSGMGEALTQSPAKKIYISNLVTKPGQTDGFHVMDYVLELERFAGVRFIDIILYNTKQPAETLLSRYAAEGEKPVRFEAARFREGYKIIGTDLISERPHQPHPNDSLIRRTLIRHDPAKVAAAILALHEE